MLVKQTNPENITKHNIHSELKLAEKLKNRKKKACFFPGMIVDSGQIMQNLIFSTEMQRWERHPEFRRKKQLLVIKRPNMEGSSLIWQRSPWLDLSSGTENTGWKTSCYMKDSGIFTENIRKMCI